MFNDSGKDFDLVTLGLQLSWFELESYVKRCCCYQGSWPVSNIANITEIKPQNWQEVGNGTVPQKQAETQEGRRSGKQRLQHWCPKAWLLQDLQLPWESYRDDSRPPPMSEPGEEQQGQKLSEHELPPVIILPPKSKHSKHTQNTIGSYYEG